MKQTEHKLWPLYPTIGHFRAHRGGLHTLTLATLKVTRFIFFFFFSYCVCSRRIHACLLR